MKYHWGRAFIAALFCASATLPALAQEQVNDAQGGEPLIVIRFNQPHLMYEHPLYNTISRALAVKPTAMFDVVSVAPQAKDPGNQPRYDQAASQNTRRVLNSLGQMGLPRERISLTNEHDAVASSEVRIYVH